MTDTKYPTVPFYIWEGKYPDFKSALLDATGYGFSGNVYLTRSLGAAEECLACLNSDQPIPAFHKQRSTYLPITTALMLGLKRQINILDFGGGLGIGYMTLVESIPNDLKRILYTIVEVPEVCKSGENLHGGKVIYTSEVPEERKFDLIYSASALQYIENWQHLLSKFTSLSPDYILLSDVFAGPITSFVALQNYYGSRIPHWFLNLNQLLYTLKDYGYRLSMKSFVTSKRLDAEDILPMLNYPEDLRLSQTLHLLFQKI